ncbi:hypothetical protein [Ruegeria arenilitoris]|uniref:hypothetical protein n=1 Tax=Ruegeria arenilitoris TaxID=1173585 RepID=UPI00147D0658|nr:hypothetical protein [Ruegeria arenilitoris]
MTDNTHWSPWRSWMPRDDGSLPGDVQPGTVVEAEFMARITHPSWPHWHDQYVYSVINGDSFRAQPIEPRNVDSPIVMRYRVQRPTPLTLKEIVEIELEPT